MELLYLILASYLVVVAIAAYLYFRPEWIRREGFATQGVDPATLPRCFLRDMEAQQLIASLPVVQDGEHTAAREEFVLILQKVLCLDADVSGSGAGVYSTLKLPYATAHDMEPIQNLVARCISRTVKGNDIVVAIDKFQARGNELLAQLCFDEISRKAAAQSFHNILLRASASIQPRCEMPKARMDIPAGPRDPGYHVQDSSLTYSEFKLTGNQPEYI